MKKINYKIEILSSLILSPRSGQALYKEIDEFCICPKVPVISSGNDDSEKNGKKEVKVVYPFYQYGEYEKYDPKNTFYYLPGSSIKGALQKGDSIRSLMVDDIEVPKPDIVLRNLWKAQFLEEKRNAKFAAFFENVGVEMIKAGSELKGDLYLKDDMEFAEVFKSANEDTKKKMSQMCTYLEELIREEEYTEAFRGELCEIKKKLDLLSCEDDVLLLGGYKGLLHSIVLPNQDKKESSGGLYVDYETMLPHGIVRIRIIHD